MPDPETDISAASRAFDPDLEGPEEDSIDGAYDPDEIEASRARELGLGVGERDLQRQRDPEGAGRPALAEAVERLSPAAAGRDEAPDLEGPDEDDAEAAYEPVEIEASGTRELELGDAGGSSQPADDDEVERLTPDEIAAADAEAEDEDEAEVEAAEEEVRDAAQAYSGMGK